MCLSADDCRQLLRAICLWMGKIPNRWPVYEFVALECHRGGSGTDLCCGAPEVMNAITGNRGPIEETSIVVVRED